MALLEATLLPLHISTELLEEEIRVPKPAEQMVQKIGGCNI